jgi:hypothetical protein
LEVATEYCPPALLNHSIRSYIWAAAYASMHRISFDVELLYVAALLHDIGLTAEFDSHTVAFEEAGGHVAWVFGAGAGWPADRRVRLREVIERHMWNEVDIHLDAEGHLLEMSTGVDISGREAEEFPIDFRAEVLGIHPRLDLVSSFVACFKDQAERKPDGRAAGLVARGLAERMQANPLERVGEGQ